MARPKDGAKEKRMQKHDKKNPFFQHTVCPTDIGPTSRPNISS
jgi:hypothetical protein